MVRWTWTLNLFVGTWIRLQGVTAWRKSCHLFHPLINLSELVCLRVIITCFSLWALSVVSYTLLVPEENRAGSHFFSQFFSDFPPAAFRQPEKCRRESATLKNKIYLPELAIRRCFQSALPGQRELKNVIIFYWCGWIHVEQCIIQWGMCNLFCLCFSCEIINPSIYL